MTSEILIEELTAYAPQLNPEEYCHGNVKQRLKNARPESKEEIRSMLNRSFARLRRRPDSLIGFFHSAGLSVRQLSLTRIERVTKEYTAYLNKE